MPHWRSPLSERLRILVLTLLATAFTLIAGAIYATHFPGNPSEPDRLRQTAQAFVDQALGRGRGWVEVRTFPTPLQVNLVINASPEDAAAVEQAVRQLLSIDPQRGDELVLVRGPAPPSWELVGRRRVAACLSLAALVALAAGLLARRQWKGRDRRCPRRSRSWLAWLRGRSPQPRPVVNGLQEAAIVLMSLPPERAAEIFKALGPQAVQDITVAISQLPQVLPELRQEVCNTFQLYLQITCQKACRERWEDCHPEKVVATLVKFYLATPVAGDMFKAISQPSSPPPPAFTWLLDLATAQQSQELSNAMGSPHPENLASRS